MTATSGGAIARAPRPSSLADVLDLILDKGLVIDAYVRISAVGIELLTIDARIVIASVDTYLHFAEAVNRLDLTQTETQGITGLFDGEGGSSNGRSSNGQPGDQSGDRSGGRSSNGRSRQLSSGRSSSGRSEERSSSRRASGRSGSGEDDDSDDGDEGKGRSMARRLGEKGRWNS